MNLIPYTIYDLVSGDVVHSGRVEERYLPAATGTHGVRVGVRLNPNTHRINLDTLRPNLLKVTKRDAWRASLPPAEPSEEAVLLHALATKAGITPADLIAARQAKLANE